MSSDAATQPAADPPESGRWWLRIDNRLEDASDWLNPILVKETRQALKSQQFVVWFLLLLAGCWVVTIGGLAIIGPSAYYAASGGQMYQFYAWMLAFPLLVVVPFSAFRSLAAEQEDNTRDVLTVSALSPRQVVNGKLGSAVLQMLIYLSALAPCLGFCYLLRGVDGLTLLLLPTLGVLASLGLSLLGLLLASLSSQRYLQVLVSVVFIGALLLIFWGSLYLVEEFVSRGYRYYRQDDFWFGMVLVLTVGATTFLLAYTAAIACNTFTSANRSTPIRLAMLVQQAAFLGWVAALIAVEPDSDIPPISYLFALAYWTLAGMALTSEQPILSERVRRGLPVSALGRLTFSWLMPGPGTGYFFAVSNITFCLLLTIGSAAIIEGRLDWLALNHPAYVVVFLFTAYATGYLGAGRLLILVLRRFAKLSLLGGFLVHMLILLAAGTLPLVIRASSNRFRFDGFSYFDVISPIALTVQFDRGAISSTESFTAGVLVVGGALSMLIANLVLTAREVRQTRAPLPQRIIEDEMVLHPQAAPRPTNPWGDLPQDTNPASPPAS